MTKQALNYLLAHLERQGYVDRSIDSKGLTRAISLTEKGWQVARLQRETVHAIEQDWSARVGTERFAAFYEVLSELAYGDGHGQRARPLHRR